MRAMSQQIGHEVSSKQLDELWNLDWKLAHELLGFPIRKCSAVPASWGNPMEDGEFDRLKLKIRRQWLRAALLFSASFSEYGWGLKVNDQSEKNLSLTENSFTNLGWLAVAPSTEQCPTGHRYLRSPVDKSLYLGGPISLSDWSSSPTVKCRASTFSKPSNKGLFFVSTLKALPVGSPITWNYGLGKTIPSLFPSTEWQLDECCSEDPSDVLNPTRTSKKRSHCPCPIQRKRHVIQAYRLCVYCGINLEGSWKNYNPSSPPPRKNMKPHIALCHAVQLCLDHGLEVDSETQGVSHAAFFSQLHMVTRVIGLLENNNYQVIPACHIFETLDRKPLPLDASQDEKDQFFCDFMYEAKESFRKYRVVYVRGITVPSNYDDLLPVKETSYADVSWEDFKAPRSNTFTVKNLLTEEQMKVVDREIQVNMENIVKTYSDLV